MSGLTRVNRNTGFTPAPSPAPILYPPSGPTSGRVTPSTAGQRGRASPGPAANQYSESPFGGGMSSGGAFGNQRSAHELEQHNDDLLSGLLGKVDTLKNVCKR
ncbi:uncharacterized protein EHS24_008496 [Apiotrichum porosum]|uniref:Uncharacterized protein n=1 Tax=Apiotrichum porosum TaxID=105984 RepID=A0A427XQC9_9TREE|nr:uncharacterized protein EHS24_008496 [Apiotrichum porosum]RSH81062.1 hypothetical protein EHS24_008496 [Apiotrichum porosum]